MRNFHKKVVNKPNSILTKDDLINCGYLEEGLLWKVMKERYGDYNNPYNQNHLINEHVTYNK